jgi:hypothetical protein
VFGTSYLEAFAYLLAPTVPGERSHVYPNTLARIDNLIAASGTFAVAVPPGYRDLFEDNPNPPLSVADVFRLSVADEALRNNVSRIIQEAEGVATASGIPATTAAQVNRIYERYKLVIPAEDCECIADILNAAWMAFRDDTLWQDNTQIAAKKDEVLKELVLKNIEVFEIEQILG